MTESVRTFDAVVVGGGPAGATAATDLARKGWSVMLLDKAGRIKPCGGAVPPRLIRDFAVPSDMIVAEVTSARMVAPSDRRVDMPIDKGYVGMVDRDVFDEWLRRRAAGAGATRVTGTFEKIARDTDGTALVQYRARKEDGGSATVSVRAKLVIGADGALSKVARQCVPGADKMPYVFAYHEIIHSPKCDAADFDPKRCDVYYQGQLSPDFYAWIFPHGGTTSVGVGSAHKGFSLRGAVKRLREVTKLDGVETIRDEGAPIPLRPLKCWDNGRDVIVVGDAAGVVAPASGEGIYYAMACARLAGECGDEFLKSGNARVLAKVRRQFMKAHGRVFMVLGIMQYFWYSSDKRRERFVDMCDDKDVQRLTWESYMNKELVRKSPLAHVKIFFKDMAHLLGIVSPGSGEA
jgi:geranylgeranyl diphosphate/geranylgeranyl-bacteriochlorophyllide a reductase